MKFRSVIAYFHKYNISARWKMRGSLGNGDFGVKLRDEKEERGIGYLDKKMRGKKWGLGGKMVNFSKKIGVKYMI